MESSYASFSHKSIGVKKIVGSTNTNVMCCNTFMHFIFSAPETRIYYWCRCYEIVKCNEIYKYDQKSKKEYHWCQGNNVWRKDKEEGNLEERMGNTGNDIGKLDLPTSKEVVSFIWLYSEELQVIVESKRFVKDMCNRRKLPNQQTGWFFHYSTERILRSILFYRRMILEYSKY